MKYINLFYISILLIASWLFFLQKNHKSNIISFYGYAENKETEINFNHPVQVKKIHVSPGQQVEGNTPMIDVIRIENKDPFSDEQYKIEGIYAEKNIWLKKIEGQIKLLKEEKSLELDKIKSQREKIVGENQFGQELYDGLSTISRPNQSNISVENKIKSIDEEYSKVTNLYDQKIKNKENELSIGSQPFDSEISRLRQQKIHYENQELIEMTMSAPKDGLIGNVYCKEEEHFSSYKTLLSFYEPNPSIIKGFIQEDFITKINLKDSILVRSTKDQELQYFGEVIGLGSRIVEIPARLRKRADMKTYGREIIVSIPEKNKFLQKEKTILELINPVVSNKNTTLISLSYYR